MPTTKSNRKVQEANRKGRLTTKSSSFHGKIPTKMPAIEQLRRPKTVPNLLPYRNPITVSPENRPKPTKMLFNVSVLGSLGPVHVLISPENTVADLIAAAVRQYVKECRRPMLPTADASGFDLHYSQFSLESLERDEKLIELGSRNYFLCPKKQEVKIGSDGTASSSSCSKEAGKASKTGIPWLKFMDFML